MVSAFGNGLPTQIQKVVPMQKSRAYRATRVKDVSLERILQNAPTGAVNVGLDVGKQEIYAVVRWSDGTFERAWKAMNPSELPLLVELLRKLGERHLLKAAMESTGTYGDALRSQLSQAGLELHRVSSKGAADYAEVFDGVPSQHDGKDAAMIAELAAYGKSSPWPYHEQSEEDAELAYWSDWLDLQQRIRMMWICRLEALLARHWPEATRVVELGSITLLKALAHYGGPAALAADPEAVRRLKGWAHGRGSAERAQRVLAAAVKSEGARQGMRDRLRMQQYATQALAAVRETKIAHRRLQELSRGTEILQRMASVVGLATSCVLWVAVGDPRNYPCGAAYRKALGLNLKERSSGQYKGRVKISKRGPANARRWLFFAAMRMVQKPSVRRWYEAKKAKDNQQGMKAVIAVARKLVLALYAVSVRGQTFEAWRLFPGRLRAQRVRPLPLT
jgi:transposase